MPETTLIAISGAAGSGKTSFSKILFKALGGNDACSLIRMDTHYTGEPLSTGELNFDHPDSLDWKTLNSNINKLLKGKNIQNPIYSFEEHTRIKKTFLIESKPIMIVEGLWALNHRFEAKQTVRIFIDVKEKVRYRRMIDRGRDLAYFDTNWTGITRSMYKEHVAPTINLADVILDNNRVSDLTKKENSLLKKFRKCLTFTKQTDLLSRF